ncbi:hypothetical protein FPZ12_026855 [Amycolatopsis acidicola]|uniref:Uncharacterized protein n=1 Tax=Amycolatopsis acidicola TaxID=2596893 RepID=A0A5N0UZC5_9PSEU|nr:hypothetical protein [Amycolatopsis acidicola]KAA9156661.1 hypothetical protein FPZ12_026855 [Amycolatopsis acidicola]
MATENDVQEAGQDAWLAEQAQEALTAIAELHEQAMATISVSGKGKTGESGQDSGWFDTGSGEGAPAAE